VLSNYGPVAISKHTLIGSMVKITIDIELTPEEVPLTNELIVTLR
jgi:hypothetical protein